MLGPDFMDLLLYVFKGLLIQAQLPLRLDNMSMGTCPGSLNVYNVNPEIYRSLSTSGSY